MTAELTNTTLHGATHLGPARALAIENGRVLVALADAKAWATVALANGYAPVVGDVLLVIGLHDAFYVIGVIAGRGRTSLTACGDLEIRAPHGSIHLLARDGITLRGGVVQVVAKAFESAVDSLRQRCKEMFVQVAGTFRTRAGRAETAVDEVHRTTAKRIVQRAEQDVSIDGEKIHLG
jgi:hypothetical protein